MASFFLITHVWVIVCCRMLILPGRVYWGKIALTKAYTPGIFVSQQCMKMLAKGTMHKVNFSWILNCSDVGNTAKFLWYPSYLTNKEILFISLMRWFKSSDLELHDPATKCICSTKVSHFSVVGNVVVFFLNSIFTCIIIPETDI